MVTTSAWWHDGSSCKSLGKSLRIDFEVKQARHIGFSASDAKLKILDRTIRIDVLNDEIVVYPCLSSSSEDHPLLHSCLGTGMRVGS